MIYFAQEGKGGPIKIGWSLDPKRRVMALQTMTHRKIKLLRSIEGDRKLESLLHRHFKSLRLKGEWFFPPDEIVKFLRNAPEKDWLPFNSVPINSNMTEVEENMLLDIIIKYKPSIVRERIMTLSIKRMFKNEL